MGVHVAPEYAVMAGFAAIGARPVRDPFESRFHFDFDELFLYLNDKAVGDMREARLAPIPCAWGQMVFEDYFKHLGNLAENLGQINPGLAQDISGLQAKLKKSRMPLFFFIEDNATSWESITEGGIHDLGILDVPLPLNLFRHRLANRLRNLKVDPELIDSLLGHADGGTATHSDLSFRIWHEDANLIRPALDTAFASLDFRRMAPWTGKVEINKPEIIKTQGSLSQKFGVAAREERRRKTNRSTIRAATVQIRSFLQGRNVSDLSEDEIDQLSRVLIFLPNGMPRANGYKQYQILLLYIERDWRKKGRKTRMGSRYAQPERDRISFNEIAPGAISVYAKLIEQAVALGEHDPMRKGISECSVIAVVLLCIRNRITDETMLKDILVGRNFRVVSLRDSFYLEYAVGMKQGYAERPCRRFKLHKNTAKFLGRVLSRGKQTSILTIPLSLNPLVHEVELFLSESAPKSPEKLIDSLATIIDQVNCLTRPGVQAAYLSGRVESYSLGWCDWVRQMYGTQIKIPSQTADKDNESVSERIYQQVSTHARISAPVGEVMSVLQTNANAFLVSIKNLLPLDDKADRGASETRRRDLARKIEDEISKAEGSVSTGILLLGRWISSTLFRKKRGRFIKPTSVARYLSSLKPGFLEAAYDSDILELDEEDVTNLYMQVLANSTAEDKRYIAERLGDFHHWAHREYGVEDPDWGELPEIDAVARVSPGYIGEEDYLRALDLLQSSFIQEISDPDVPSLILMFCYRFGLRFSEAWGLLRSDIIINEDMMLVYVSNNKYRRLKVPTTRRQVPLLFELSEYELKILDRYLLGLEGKHGSAVSAPLFGDITTDNLIKRKKIAPPILAALKTATGNPDMTLHHARHSAANRIALAVLQPELRKIGFNSGMESASEKSEFTLLGATGVTRRKTWAISRYAGHARRGTTWKHYLHFLGELCDAEVREDSAGRAVAVQGAINIDKFTLLDKASVGQFMLSEVAAAQPSVSRILKLARLLARGKDCSCAGELIGLPDQSVRHFLWVFSHVAKKIFGSQLPQETAEPEQLAALLVRQLKEPAWDRIVQFSIALENSNSAVPSVPKFEISDLTETIGLNRQIVLWNEWHFELLRAFVDYFGIDTNDFIVLRNEKTSEELATLAESHKFTVRDAISYKSYRFQLDTATTMDGRFTVNDRCAFVFIQNDQKPIRNSYELTVCFLVFAICKADQSRKTKL